ncbi:MAG TPA: hypothetical protein VEJ63_06990 [Planctomycetota bacterium]|nr:hypothetical protein [Planctomycetota bacterium]
MNSVYIALLGSLALGAAGFLLRAWIDRSARALTPRQLEKIKRAKDLSFGWWLALHLLGVALLLWGGAVIIANENPLAMAVIIMRAKGVTESTPPLEKLTELGEAMEHTMKLMVPFLEIGHYYLFVAAGVLLVSVSEILRVAVTAVAVRRVARATPAASARPIAGLSAIILAEIAFMAYVGWVTYEHWSMFEFLRELTTNHAVAAGS